MQSVLGSSDIISFYELEIEHGASMTRILIKKGYVATVDTQRRIYSEGFVAIDGPRISAVGPSEQTPAAAGFDELIDASGSIVVPGLINMHQHHWYTLFKGIADGLLLEDWVTDILLPLSLKLDVSAMRVSNYLAGMEMLATGTTCSLNHSVTTTTRELVAASIEPQAELGIRQVYAKELRCKTPGNPHHPLNLDEALAEFEHEVSHWNGKYDGLVRFGIAIESNAHWVAAGMSTEELICRGYELAKRHGLKITAHIAGGTLSLEKGFLKYLRETGRTDVRYLMQLGILDPQWILIHGIHCTELDIEQMARVGCSFVYTPTSEAIRGGGISPFANARRAGVNVALGTDGPMVDYSVDMVEQMKVCTLMQHVRHLDPTRMPVECSLEMATINAAKALGLESEIGSLEVGKRADIAIFDLKKPYVGVLHRPLSSLVTAGKGSDVRAVLVDGRIVYRDGEFTNLGDSERVIAEAETIGRSIIAKAGLGHRLTPDWRM
jgi:5-methylthioadenosine/S-adenosylhomocysteine deaminase